MAFTDLGALLLEQWQDSPRMRALVTDVLERIRDDIGRAVDRLAFYRAIDNAQGVWLDRIGEALGLRRPSTSDPAQDTRFGFDAAGVGWDQAPFRGDAANDAVYPLGDDVYRRLVKARAVTVLADGTCQTYARAVKIVDPGAVVVDQRNMRVRVTTTDRALLVLADEIEATPRTGGVEVEYADRGRFGFDDAGVGWDQGPFAGV